MKNLMGYGRAAGGGLLLTAVLFCGCDDDAKTMDPAAGSSVAGSEVPAIDTSSAGGTEAPDASPASGGASQSALPGDDGPTTDQAVAGVSAQPDGGGDGDSDEDGDEPGGQEDSGAGEEAPGDTFTGGTQGNVGLGGEESPQETGDNDPVDPHADIPVESQVTAAIGSGQSHILVVKTDGTVWASGGNGHGQLGSGVEDVDAFSLQRVLLLENMKAVAGGQYHSLALRDDGSVWGWGLNGNGQIGDNDPARPPLHTSPIQAVELTNVVTLAAGGTHSFAINEDGQLFSWGNNSHGQTGTPGVFPRVPTQILENVKDVSGGLEHTLAVTEDGQAWSWGNSFQGQLGHGNNDALDTPTQIAGLDNVTAVAAGWSFSLVLKADGSVWGFGTNGVGQLGNWSGNSFEYSNVPIQIQGLAGIVAISAGHSHALAVDSEGAVWAWGSNTNGQLGMGTRSFEPTMNNHPVPVDLPAMVLDVQAGGDHALARSADGVFWTWGHNRYGQLANGRNGLSSPESDGGGRMEHTPVPHPVIWPTD